MADITKTLRAPIEELNQGTLFAERYKIIEELGSGGMGKVYRVLDKKTDEELALKLIRPEVSADKKTIERFTNELKLAHKISHRNVCRIFHLGEEEGTHYITMEYLKGEDLKNRLDKVKRFDANTFLDIAKQLCEGLSEAHRVGVIHRDLKPANIMIDKDGHVQIMDFGIARSLEAKGVTEAGMIIGTPEYMSPEQVEGKRTDQRSDIYSLGIILYEMLTGQVPFKGETLIDIAIKQKSEKPKDPSEIHSQIPKSLARLILKCLEKDKEKRFQNTALLMSELQRLGEADSEDIQIPEEKTSIAVLPFTNMSADPEQEYFCDGMSEELINALTKVKELHVVARTSAFSFKGKDIDIREIGEKLDVDKVLEGSVRKAGDKLRITAQLINVSDGYHLWSERYDREMDDVFAIQDEITMAIVDNLKVSLLGGEKTEITKRHTKDLDAYNLYLKGRHFWSIRTGEGFKKAIECYQHALKIDPNYAPAYAGMADAFGFLGFFSFVPPQDVFTKCKEMAKKALAIDNMLSEAHTSLAMASGFYERNWSYADREFKRAIEINPNNPYAQYLYALYLIGLDRLDEAEGYIHRALALDPLSHIINMFVAFLLLYRRQYDESIKAFKRALELHPTFGMAYIHLGRAYCMKKMYKEAISAVQKGVDFSGGAPIARGLSGCILALSGQKDEAEKVLFELKERAELGFVPSFAVMLIYIGLGDKDNAFEWFENGIEQRDPALFHIKASPEADILRSDPRYEALLKKMNLA